MTMLGSYSGTSWNLASLNPFGNFTLGSRSDFEGVGFLTMVSDETEDEGEECAKGGWDAALVEGEDSVFGVKGRERAALAYPRNW